MSYRSGQTPDDQLRDDVRAAMEGGLDGFAINAFSGAQAKNLLESFIRAADSVGADNFKLILSADMSLGFKPDEIVDTIVRYGGNPHYLKVGGKPLLSSYGGDGSMEWWSENVLRVLETMSHPVTFVPYFDRPHPNWDTPSSSNWQDVINRSGGVDGLFNFLIPGSTPFYSQDPNIGHHWWSILEAEESLSKALHDRGKFFIAPYMPYYWAVCHPARQYVEEQGGRGMTNWWTSIINVQRPEMVELITWNDYSESTYVQPTRVPLSKTPGVTSYSHIGYYELLKYYIAWYRNGHAPSISNDALFYFYRPQQRRPDLDATDSSCKLGRVKESQLWGKVENAIYVTTALTHSAELVARNAFGLRSFQVPDGIATTTIPINGFPLVLELWANDKLIQKAKIMGLSDDNKSDNFNVESGYLVSTGASSDSWNPSDAWKTGRVSVWFR
jgi:glucan endo-1,3-alpha-glucosidase